MAKQWHQLERLDHKALKKLQTEREKAAKLAAAAEARKKQMIIGGGVLVALIAVFVLIGVINTKAKAKQFQEDREKLLYSSVTEYSGTAESRKTGLWEALTANIKFKEEYSFRTMEESSLTVQMQLENQVKLYADTEVTVKPPTLEAKENKIKQEVVELTRGEITAAVSLDGRDLMCIQASNVKIIGRSGLFKVIYKDEEDKGEIVVKNGLVEVSTIAGGEKPVKLSGFYKLTFDNGELSSPSQASVIQYDWR